MAESPNTVGLEESEVVLDPESQPDLIFDKYQIIRRLAVGGMGEIFLARQVGVAGFNRLVILKSLLNDLAEDKEFIEQFLDEARIAATLNHPNIIAIYEVGLWQGTYYMAMEYIRGDNLSTLILESIRQERKIPSIVTANIIADAALGLDFAHYAENDRGKRLNIVHRDVGTQNIMVRADGLTKIVDFGIAKATNRSSRTATGMLKGKIEYMAPEQLESQPLDGRSDQFALGVVFWEMLTQKRLLSGKNQVETINNVLYKDIPAPSEIAPHAPKEFDEIVLRMLKRDRDQRFERCIEVSTKLRQYISSQTDAIGQQEAGVFVSDVLADKLDAATKDLAPSEENFLIDLGRGEIALGDDDLEIERTRTIQRRQRQTMGGIIAAVLVGLLAVGVWLFTQPEPVPQTTNPVVANPSPGGGAIEPPTLSLTSAPEGATVRLGDQVLGVTPLTVATLVPNTEHTLTLSRDGYRDGELTLTMAPGDTVERAILLDVDPKAGRRGRRNNRRNNNRRRPPAGIIGSLSLATTPWTEVEIDGEPYGTTPLFQVKLAPGVHNIRFVNEQENINTTRRVVIKANKTTRMSYDLKK